MKAFWYTALLWFSSTIGTLSYSSLPLPGGGDTPLETLAVVAPSSSSSFSALYRPRPSKSTVHDRQVGHQIISFSPNEMGGWAFYSLAAATDDRLFFLFTLREFDLFIAVGMLQEFQETKKQNMLVKYIACLQVNMFLLGR